MSKESYFTLACGLATISFGVVQGICPLISPILGWPIVGILGILTIFLLIIGIRKKESLKSLVLTPHAWAIGLSGMTGYPTEPENAWWLLLEVSTNAIDKPIDTVDLRIGDKTTPANYWPGKIVTAFNVYFNVTGWRYQGRNQVELIAHVGDKMHRSGRIAVDFNAEPWGSHRI